MAFETKAGSHRRTEGKILEKTKKTKNKWHGV
jgi:hypothetical protein